MNLHGKSRNAILILLVLAVISAGCSEKITDTTGQEAELKIKASPGASVNLRQVARFTLTVTGPGLVRPIVTPLLFENGYLTGTVLVPAGPGRSFLIEAFDETGRVIYSGRTVTDVTPDVTVELNIDLYPRIPMIKLSPSYYFEPFGSLLAFRLKVYNMVDLRGIRIKIDNQSEILGRGFYADSVVVNPEIAGVTSLNWWVNEMDYSTTIYMAHRYTGSSILDESGYRELATVYFGTYYPYGGPSSDVYSFTPAIIDMVDLEGDTLSGKDIYSETSTAELFHHSEHQVAFWDMDWTSEDPDSVIDTSTNRLHGMASGTSWDEGIFGGARVFDGVDDFIRIPDNPLLDLSDGITISFWINIRDYGEEDSACIISKMASDAPINYQFLVSGLAGGKMTSFLFGYGKSPYQIYYVEVPGIIDAGWRNVIFSYQFGDPSSAIFVLDLERREGEWFEDTGRIPPPASDGPLMFGKRLDSDNPFYFRGGLDEVELYDVSFDWEAIRYVFFPR